MTTPPTAATDAAIEIGGRRIPLADGETVLDALERSGIDAPSGCRAGTCCKRMQQADDPPAASQRGLRPTLSEQGFFLACQARPESTLRLRDGEPPATRVARIQARDEVANDVIRFRIRTDCEFVFRPGQYLDVVHPSGLARSYSIASLPTDEVLELHVRHVPNGLVSGWLHSLDVGAVLSVRGAYGQCYYVADDPSKKMLLVGTGTGLAPLLGIARDALASGHSGPVDLIHGGLDPSRLYIRDELGQLAAEFPQLRVHHCVLQGATEHEHEGALAPLCIRLSGALKHTRAFLCGAPELVRQLQRALFLAGMPSSEFPVNPFTAAAPGRSAAG